MQEFSTIPKSLLKSKIYTVVITDLEGKFIFSNNYFHERFPLVPKDIIGQPFSTTIHPEDIEKCNMAAYECIIDPEKVVSLEIRKPTKNINEWEWTNWEFSLFQDINGNPLGIFCLGYSITEIKKLVSELAQRRGLMSNIAKSQSHELRKPVSNIMGLVELIELDKFEDKEVILNYLSVLKSEVDKLDDIIHKVVELASKK